jgi:hypothetical protein
MIRADDITERLKIVFLQIQMQCGVLGPSRAVASQGKVYKAYTEALYSSVILLNTFFNIQTIITSIRYSK